VTRCAWHRTWPLPGPRQIERGSRGRMGGPLSIGSLSNTTDSILHQPCVEHVYATYKSSTSACFCGLEDSSDGPLVYQNTYKISLHLLFAPCYFETVKFKRQLCKHPLFAIKCLHASYHISDMLAFLRHSYFTLLHNAFELLRIPFVAPLPEAMPLAGLLFRLCKLSVACWWTLGLIGRLSGMEVSSSEDVSGGE